MPIIKFYDNETIVELYPTEPIGCFGAVSRKYMLNDYKKKFDLHCRAMLGRKPNYKSADDIRLMNEFTYNPQVQRPNFSNYLSGVEEKLRGKEVSYHNPVTNRRYRQGETWDGNFRYIKQRRNELVIPSGASRTVLGFLKRWFKENKHEFKVEFEVYRTHSPEKFLSPEPVYTIGGKLLRPHQQEVIDLIRKRMSNVKGYGHMFGHFLLDLAVNFGKSLVTTALIHNFLGAKNLNLVMTQSLFLKTIADYVEAGLTCHYMAPNAVKSKVKKHLIAEGLDPEMAHLGWGGNQVAMIPTLASRLRNKKKPEMVQETANYLSQYAIGILDEVDMMSNDSGVLVLGQTKFAMKVPMSGTPYESDRASDRYFVWSLAGAAALKYSHAKMVELGFSLPIEYRMIPMDKGLFSFSNSMSGLSNTKELDIYYNSAWLDKISKILSKHQGELCMIYMGSQKIEYLEQITNGLRQRGHDVEITHGGDDQRHDKLQEFKDGHCKILVTNVIASTGLNIPNLGVFIYGSLSKSSREFIQALVGRTARVGDGQEKALVYDFMYSEDFGEYHVNSMYRKYYASRKDMDLEIKFPFNLDSI